LATAHRIDINSLPADPQHLVLPLAIAPELFLIVWIDEKKQSNAFSPSREKKIQDVQVVVSRSLAWSVDGLIEFKFAGSCTTSNLSGTSAMRMKLPSAAQLGAAGRGRFSAVAANGCLVTIAVIAQSSNSRAGTPYLGGSANWRSKPEPTLVPTADPIGDCQEKAKPWSVP